MRFLTAGTDGLLIELADMEQALALFDQLLATPLAGVGEVVPAARTVLVRFDPLLTSVAQLREQLTSVDLSKRSVLSGETFDIPVIYDGEDIAEVAALLGWSIPELIQRHTAAVYTVAFTGFAPGFAYMSCSDPAFDVPRRSSPRVRIPAGSVALAGRFGGIYPSDSPGGWQLLGRTTIPMWDLSRVRPALLVPGDRVRFREASADIVATPVRVEQTATTIANAKGPRLTIVRADRPVLMQDDGRPDQAAQGVSRSGALDRASFHAVNRLLGNAPNTPALELVFGGVELKADAPVTLALSGAPCLIQLKRANQSAISLPANAPFALDAGDVVSFAAPPVGMVSYLGVRGGFAVDLVMGSAAYDTLSRIGPAPLTAGARLSLAGERARAVEPHLAAAAQLPASGDCVEIDVLVGPRDDWFTSEGLRTLSEQEWRVTAEVSRVGKRLSGVTPLERLITAELPSEATVPGAIQVPHSGQPVVFLADHPVTGGYPVVAVIARHHLDLAAQVPPGARIRFRPINQVR